LEQTTKPAEAMSKPWSGKKHLPSDSPKMDPSENGFAALCEDDPPYQGFDAAILNGEQTHNRDTEKYPPPRPAPADTDEEYCTEDGDHRNEPTLGSQRQEACNSQDNQQRNVSDPGTCHQITECAKGKKHPCNQRLEIVSFNEQR